MRNGRIICGVVFTVLLLLVVSCSKPEESDRGTVTLSSKFNFDNASVYGYNFELARSTVFPSTGEPLPDIIVDQFRLIDGTVKPGFSSPDNPDGFWKAGEFGTLFESMDFFEKELQTVDHTVDFSPSTDTVRIYQVYVLKTTSGNYAKIRVSEILEIEDAAGKHIDVKIDYHYQPDGSTGFTD